MGLRSYKRPLTPRSTMAKNPAPSTSAPTPVLLARVTNTRPTFVDFPGLGRMGPGESKNIPDATVAGLEDLPADKGPGKVWAAMRRAGWLRVVRASSPEAKAATRAPEGTPPPPSLVELPETGAVALASVEDSQTTLAAWYGAERREAVRVAITARLATLTASAQATPAA